LLWLSKPLVLSAISRTRFSNSIQRGEYTASILSHTTGVLREHVEIADVGPSAKYHGNWLGRPLDRTWALCQALGHMDDDECSVWINGPDGTPMKIGGWDFKEGHVAE
jgi:hypothetical protein